MAVGIRADRSTLFVCAMMLSFGALTGCKGGSGSSADSNSNPATPAATPAAAPGPTTTAPSSAPSPATTSHSPVISGAAPVIAETNAPYAFKPLANDPDGDTLSFQIQNKPSWATFNTVTGELTGTPGGEHAGAYADIVISTSDGEMSAALDAFTITVNAPAPVASPVSLSWIAPTQNVDGSTLTALSGFVISFGTSPDMLSRSVFVGNPSVDTFVFEDLAPGTYYFAVRALSANGETGELSKLVEKVVG